MDQNLEELSVNYRLPKAGFICPAFQMVTSVMSAVYSRIIFMPVPSKTAMVKYKVTLTKEEFDELMTIISKDSHTSAQFRTAYNLLNCDEGDYGEKISGKQICQVLKVCA